MKMIIIGLGIGIPIGLLSVLIYLINGHSLYELSHNGIKGFYRKKRMELLGETQQEINKSFDKFHRGKSVGEYRPFTDKLVVLTITVVMGFVCYEFGYNQGNFWILAGVGIVGWIFAGFGLLDDGWERMQGFTVNSPFKHFSVRIPELEEARNKERRKGIRNWFYCMFGIVLIWVIIEYLLSVYD